MTPKFIVMDTGEKIEERRIGCQHCGDHPSLTEAISKSVPRWVFLSTLGAAITLALTLSGSFALVQKQAIQEVTIALKLRMSGVEKHVGDRMSDLRVQYTEDVRRFFNAAEKNHTLLTDLNKEIKDVQIEQVRQGELQRLVLQKVKMAEPQ